MNININRFIQNNTYIDKNEKSIIKFGIDMMITTIVAFIVAFIIAIIMGMIREGIVFLISIIMLRQYAGGYHASSQKVCAVLSCIIYLSGLIIIKNYTVYNSIQIMMCVISVFIIFLLSPVDNINNELTRSERKYLRKEVRFFLSSEVLIFVILLIKANEYWSGIIVISMMIVAILVLAGFIENEIRG